MTGEQQKIKISFSLPTCLYLQDDFIFNIDQDIKIIHEETREEYDSRFGRGINVEVKSDTNAAFRFSKLTIEIPDYDPNIPGSRLVEVYNLKIIEAVNKFIDAYRFLSNRPAIANIQDLKNMRELSVGLIPQQIFETRISFGGGLTNSPILSKTEHNKLQKLLTGGVPLEEIFFMEAERHYALGHFLQSLVSAVIAIEIILNSCINIKIPIIFRIFYKKKKLIYKIEKVLSDKIDFQKMSLLIGAIKDRNRIVHNGKREINNETIRKYLDVIKESIEKIKLNEKIT